MYIRKAGFYIWQKFRDYFLRDILVNSIASSYWVTTLLRSLIYCSVGIQKSILDIGPGCRFKSFNVKIGKKTFINDHCSFQNLDLVKIGDNCAIGPEVMFCTLTHEIGDTNRRANRMIEKPVIIGNGCWIGARVLILPGIKIGEGCIIAAGAVVTRDCDPNGLYAGMPAKRIKDLVP